MRAFSAILGLLLCLIATRAEELPVIKDAEAIHYVGKNVEVRGRVVSVTTSPLGTAFICFGRDYLNQTFAGFIAVGSKMTTDQRIAFCIGPYSRSPCSMDLIVTPVVFLISQPGKLETSQFFELRDSSSTSAPSFAKFRQGYGSDKRKPRSL